MVMLETSLEPRERALQLHFTKWGDSGRVAESAAQSAANGQPRPIQALFWTEINS
jgi:hypothetical protein